MQLNCYFFYDFKIKIYDENNAKFKNDFDLYNYCNEYFTNVGPDLEKKTVPKQPFKLNLLPQFT